MNEPLKRLYDRHAPALRLYALTWCRNPEDAVQEALIDLAKQSQMPTEPVAWLYRAVKFRAMNLHRSQRRRSEREKVAADQRASFFVNDPANQIDAMAVESALQRLEETDREIVVARIWGGLSFEQIAELTKLSSSSAHRHYQASLKELKQYLSESNCPISSKGNPS